MRISLNKTARLCGWAQALKGLVFLLLPMVIRVSCLVSNRLLCYWQVKDDGWAICKGVSLLIIFKTMMVPQPWLFTRRGLNILNNEK